MTPDVFGSDKGGSLIYLVDTIQVEPDKLDDYLRAVETIGVPIMTGAGADLDSCWATSPQRGEEVHVKVAWSCEDHQAWNEIRINYNLSPLLSEYNSAIHASRIGGSRRFYYPAQFSRGRRQRS